MIVYLFAQSPDRRLLDELNEELKSQSFSINKDATSAPRLGIANTAFAHVHTSASVVLSLDLSSMNVKLGINIGNRR